MNREYHLEQLLRTAETLRRYSDETFRYVELNNEGVLLEIYSHNDGTRFYIADVWHGYWIRLEDLNWKEVNSDQDADSGYRE